MSDAPTERSEPRNVLLLAPAMSDDQRACVTLSAGPRPGATAFLTVLYTRSPDDVLSKWRSHAAGLPAQFSVISVGGQRRASTVRTVEETTTELRLEVVDEPRDLTGLAMRISGQLSEWDDAAEVRFCFDSLTALVQYAELERVFRFLHVLTNRLSQMGAVAHFHLDPGAVEDRTARTVAQLFDETLRYDDVGEVEGGNATRGTTGSPTDVGSD